MSMTISETTIAAPPPVNSTPAVKVVETTDDYGKFEIEPLEPGFGTTLGNSLRRVLLSSLDGAAVTSVSIDGVAHEFSSIPQVREDVTEILLNLKGLNLISHSPEPIRLILEVKGPKQVTAGDIRAPSDVEIVNPELYICSIDDKSTTLRAELVVERGKGYVPADRNKKEDQPIGVIPIDAIFSPVVKANFLVEKTRVGQETDWDKLILELWTDRTIKPEDAVSDAARIFTRHLDLFARFGESILAAPVEGEKAGGLAAGLGRCAGGGAGPVGPGAQLPQGQRHHQDRAAAGQARGRAPQPAQLRQEVARRDQGEAGRARLRARRRDRQHPSL